MNREQNRAAFMQDSKAVHETGEPKRLYHATASDFSVFDPKKAAKNSGHPASRLGHFLAETPEAADLFARVPDKFSQGTGEYKAGANIMPVIAAIKNPHVMHWKDFAGALAHINSMPIKKANKAVDDFKKELMDAGHDGILIKGGWKPGQLLGSPEFSSNNWVAFDQGQMKSDTGNDGGFDPTNPDITKAGGGSAMFHGTDVEDLQHFDPTKSRTAKYHYLADDPETAKGYGKHVYKVKLNPKNVIDFHPDNIGPKHAQVVNELADRLGEEPEYLMNAITSADGSFYGSRGSLQDQVMDELKDMGYDAVRFPDPVPGGGWDMSTVVLDNGIIDGIDKHQEVGKKDGGALDDDSDYPGITAYHGSPYDFERFDTSKIGTGEGAQVYGHGLYFAENEPVAKNYRDQLRQEYVYVDGEKMPHPSEETPHTNTLYTFANQLYQMGWDADQAVEFAKQHAESLKPDLESDNFYKQRKAQHAQEWAEAVEPFKGKKIEWRQDPGHMYEVHIKGHPDHFLD